MKIEDNLFIRIPTSGHSRLRTGRHKIFSNSEYSLCNSGWIWYPVTTLVYASMNLKITGILKITHWYWQLVRCLLRLPAGPSAIGTAKCSRRVAASAPAPATRPTVAARTSCYASGTVETEKNQDFLGQKGQCQYVEVISSPRKRVTLDATTLRN